MWGFLFCFSLSEIHWHAGLSVDTMFLPAGTVLKNCFKGGGGEGIASKMLLHQKCERTAVRLISSQLFLV